MPILNIQHCLTCGRMVAVQHDNFHFIVAFAPDVQSGTAYDYKECEGPFTVTPPPDDLEKGWQDSLTVPPVDDMSYSRHIDFDIETDQNILLDLI